MSFYRLVRACFRPIGRAYFRLRVEGGEHLPAEGPLILAANHSSWLDPVVLGAASPRPVRFLIARSVYEEGGARWFYRWMSTIPVERGGQGLSWARSALRALGEGHVVGVFPEGAGLDPQGRDREGFPGAILLGARSGAPLVPVGLAGTFASWPPGRGWPRPGRVVVRFGTPWRPWSVGDRPDREAVRRTLEGLMERIRDLGATEPR